VPQAITAADIGARLDLTLDATIYLHVPEPVLVQRLLGPRPDRLSGRVLRALADAEHDTSVQPGGSSLGCCGQLISNSLPSGSFIPTA
jgi:hypothetical protein